MYFILDSVCRFTTVVVKEEVRDNFLKKTLTKIPSESKRYLTFVRWVKVRLSKIFTKFIDTFETPRAKFQWLESVTHTHWNILPLVAGRGRDSIWGANQVVLTRVTTNHGLESSEAHYLLPPGWHLFCVPPWQSNCWGHRLGGTQWDLYGAVSTLFLLCHRSLWSVPRRHQISWTAVMECSSTVMNTSCDGWWQIEMKIILASIVWVLLLLGLTIPILTWT